MKVLFINDSTSNPNWGDRAAAISLRRMILDSGGEIVATISEDELRHAAFFRSSRSEHAGAPSSTMKERAKLFIPPIVLKLREKLLSGSSSSEDDNLIPQRFNDFEDHVKRILKNDEGCGDLRRMIEESEVIVIHGDGCMTGNGRIPRAELFLSYVARKHFNKRVIIVNHTADFSDSDLRRMAEEVYPLLDDVVFRDTISVERCRAMCAGRYAADTAFWFKPAPREEWAAFARRQTYFDVWPDMAQFDPGRPYICVGGSSAFSYDGEPVEIVADCLSLIEHIQSVYTGQVVLTVSDVVDQAVFRPIAAKLQLPLVGLTTSVQQVVDILGNADAYVGGRWHPSIFALRGGTPIVPISSKTFKIEALAEMAGLSSSAFHVSSLQQEKELICGQLLSHLQQGNELRNRLRQWAEGQAENSWDNVSYLKKYDKRSDTTAGVR